MLTLSGGHVMLVAAMVAPAVGRDGRMQAGGGNIMRVAMMVAPAVGAVGETGGCKPVVGT